MDIYGKGKWYIDEAIKSDLDGNYLRAVPLYADAIEAFIHALR